MPRYRGGVHQAGRSRRPPRVRAEGQWFGMGPQERDAHWGIDFPSVFVVDNEGLRVSEKLKDHSFDMPPEY